MNALELIVKEDAGSITFKYEDDIDKIRVHSKFVGVMSTIMVIAELLGYTPEKLAQMIDANLLLQQLGLEIND